MELTKEYMMQYCQLTEADFDGIDFDDFRAHYHLTPESLEKFNGKMLLSLYRFYLEQGPSIDYTVIYEQASGQIQEEDIPHITAVIWELHDGNRNRCMAADFETKALYGGEGAFLKNCRESDKVCELAEDDVEFIRQAIIQSGIKDWDNRYIGTSEGTTGNFSWTIGFRLDSGKCYDYHGSGVMNSGTPDAMDEFCEALWEKYMGRNNE